jgi:hypothetical protein
MVRLAADRFGMLNSGAFKFVLGYGSGSLIPAEVMPYVLQFVHFLLSQDKVDIWWAFCEAFCQSMRPLSGISAVLIFRDKSGAVCCREVGYSVPHGRTWGTKQICPDCKDGLNITSHYAGPKKTNGASDAHSHANFECLRCGFKAKRVPMPEWLKRVRQTQCFWHDYPLTKEQEWHLGPERTMLATTSSHVDA